MCEETPTLWKVAHFLCKIGGIMAAIVFCTAMVFLFILFLGLIDEALGGEGRIGPKSWTAVCPCRKGLDPKVLVEPANGPNDKDTIERLRKTAANDYDCWGCQDGFPRIFSLEAWFHAKKHIQRKHQIIYLGEEAP